MCARLVHHVRVNMKNTCGYVYRYAFHTRYSRRYFCYSLAVARKVNIIHACNVDRLCDVLRDETHTGVYVSPRPPLSLEIWPSFPLSLSLSLSLPQNARGNKCFSSSCAHVHDGGFAHEQSCVRGTNKSRARARGGSPEETCQLTVTGRCRA